MDNRIIRDITEFIFLQDTPRTSDLILIPGSSQWQITEKAAELYHQGYAPYILPSGRFSSNVGHFAGDCVTDPRYMGDHATDFEYCKHILLVNGVPERAILREDQATNSMENAMYSAKVVCEFGLEVKRAILCCQAFHARRAYMSYACHFRSVELLVVPVATQGIRREDWFRTERSFKKVLQEVEKCGKYFSGHMHELRCDFWGLL